jgi:hypothetical protein
MGRIGIKSIAMQDLTHPISLKRDILFFDKIQTEISLFEKASMFANEIVSHPKIHGGRKKIYEGNIKDIHFLRKRGLLEFSKPTGISGKNLTDEDIDLLKPALEYEKTINLLNDNVRPLTDEETVDVMEFYIKFPSFFARTQALALSKEDNTNTYIPLIRDDQCFKTGKESVIRFVLKQLPEPAENVEWQHILEFKSDPNTASRYFALLKWINDISKRNLSAIEFEDEFMSLYTDYCQQYKLHKMESKLNLLETLVVGVTDVLGRFETPQLTSLVSSYLNYRKQGINLLKAEASMPGRELAYIYKANERFD